MSSRLDELDVFRGLAAFFVVLFHLTTRFDELYGHSLAFSFEIGKYGVQWFFLISGFVIFLTLNRTKSALGFITARFSRLFPVYWLAVILTTSVVNLVGLPGKDFSLTTASLNLTMVPAFFEVSAVDGVYWTLEYELIFYCLMLVVWLMRGLQKIEFICMGWLTLQASWLLSEYYTGYFPWKIRLIFMLDYAHLFMAGILFYRLKASVKGDRYNLIRHSLIMLCFGMQCWIDNELVSWGVVLGLFLSFYLFVYHKLSVICLKPLIYLGTISYSLYLFHHNIGFSLLHKLYLAGMPSYEAIPLVMLCCLFIASLATRYVEKPALRFLRSQFTPHNHPAKAV
ncbi:acyltransferase family protein [Zooshikella sp. RANM57]|uniref:acyltransferase family protein n=1 Tax=Zooshikella sp. RANM57 TaxID=3425863 RepID=UPI003D6F22D8